MLSKRLGILILAATLAAGTATTALAVAGAGAIVLEFPVDARYNALGEAGTALAQDAASLWWNPGGLAFATDVHRARAAAMQSKLVPDLADDIRLYWGGYVTSAWGGAFGAHISYLDMGTQTATNDAGDPTGEFSSNMWAFGVGYGTKMSANLGIGFGVKFYHDKLADNNVLQDGTGGSASTFAVDAGLLYKVPGRRMNIGFALRNIGPDVTHVDSDQSDPLPRTVTLGVAYGLVQNASTSLLLVGDVMVPLLKWSDSDQDYSFQPDFDQNEWGVGAEWGYADALFLRFGYKKGTGEIEDTTWGLGLDLGNWLGKNIVFGYASIPQAKGLDRVTRISVGYDF